MRHGYARISAEEQNLARQRRALAAAGCDHVVEEIESGVKARRRLDGLLSQLQAGDELIVSELDRLGRGTGEAVLLMDELIRREIKLTVLSLPSLDIGTNDGRLIADILASLAAHERRRLRERQRQGINAARLAGRHLGRRPKMNLLQVREARQRIAADESVSVVARAYGVTPKTLRATLDRTSQAGG
jgi:putative DNA-invertase from lambdoid prophage Rac